MTELDHAARRSEVKNISLFFAARETRVSGSSKTGTPYAMLWAEVFRFWDGRVVRIMILAVGYSLEPVVIA